MEGAIQVLVSNTLIGVQVPASAPAMYKHQSNIDLKDSNANTMEGSAWATASQMGLCLPVRKLLWV